MSAIDATRLRYRVVRREAVHFVVAERGLDGYWEFWDQEAGELRWYPFSPSPAERAAAMLLRDTRATYLPVWPLLSLTTK